MTSKANRSSSNNSSADDDDDEPLIMKFRTDAASKTDSDLKTKYALGATVVYLSIALASGYCTMNFILAASYFAVYNLFLSLWVRILLYSPNIYSIRVPTAMIDDWIPLSIPHDKLSAKKDRVVTSISELSGIRGSYMMIAIRSSTAMGGVITGLAACLDIASRDAKFLLIQSGQDMVPVMMIMSAIGFMLIGIFDLNGMDKFHATMHYAGLAGATLGMFMICFLSNWSKFGVGLLCLVLAMEFYWVYLMISVPKRSSNLATVTKISKKCIGWEVAALEGAVVIATLTIYACGPNKGDFLASPFK